MAQGLGEVNDEDIKEFIEYFKDELPDPDHHPLKVIWLMKWYQSIVMRNRNDNNNRH